MFGSFVLGDEPTLKMFGLGLAVAIFIDATIVRMVLVPATMELLGDRNWWFPKWLDRIIPRLHVEPIDDVDAELARAHRGAVRPPSAEAGFTPRRTRAGRRVGTRAPGTSPRAC